MTFDEILTQIVELLQRQGRVSYGALKRRFAFDDEYLQDLKDELIDAQRIARDEKGKVLVWVGKNSLESRVQSLESEGHGRDSTIQTLDPKPKTLDSAAERRQLTVLFCDVVGSTALSTQLDPEELREVVRAYQETCAEVINRFDGHIAQYQGDGLLVYFGYPLAHEDDARRAVQTGLGIIAALQEKVPSPLPGKERRLQVRIGIHTGLVVVGEIGDRQRHEHLALGETPNIATGLQGIAAPNTVVISAATVRLVHGYFNVQERGLHTLKGIGQPVVVYQVLRESGARSRLQIARTTGLTPLVGREQEVALLFQRWAQAKEGRGGAILVSGEAGVGKSRLVQTLIEHVLPEPHFRLVMRCSSYHQNSAFYPVIDLLQRLLDFQQGDPSVVKLAKLKQNLSGYSSVPADALPLIASLLSLSGEHLTLPAMPPQRQRQRTIEALLAWLLAGASSSPLLAVIEDLHWIDPSTRELITLFIDQLPTARILALFTFRPEFVSPWSPRSHLSTLMVTRLGRQQVGHMVTHLAGGKRLPREVRRHIVAKTDGIPLYIEEMSKMMLELGLLREREGRYELTGPLPTETIPATLSDSLMARLDRLSTVKDVVQLGATIGREFSYEVLRALSPHNEETLRVELSRLVDAEVLYQSGFLPQTTYIFKHALIREAAYQSLLKSTRQQYHQQIAHVLIERFSDSVETQPELLAQHLTAAELIAEAIPYWQRAGQKAMQRFANAEAISQFSMALELLRKLPLTAERNRTELALGVALSGSLLMTKGYAAPEVGAMYARALELSQQLEDSLELTTVLGGLTAFYVARGELRSALVSAERLLQIAQRGHDRVLSLAAHSIVAIPIFWLGDVASARAHWEAGLALYDPQRTQLYGGVQDFGVTCLSYLGLALWMQGYSDQGVARGQEAIALAQKLDHPFSLSWAMNFSSRAWQRCREISLVREQTSTLTNLTTEHGFNQHRAHAMILHGWALAAEGKGPEGIALMQEGLAALRVTGAELSRPWFMTLLAEGYGMNGQFEAGLEVLTEARIQAEQSEEKVSLSEIYRLIGELTLQKLSVVSCQLSVTDPRPPIPDPQGEAEACFLKAIDIARKQQAKSLELRAVMSLVRLRQQQAAQHEPRTRLDAAHRMLSEIYNWFTEGFDTKDLQEAKALLDELTSKA